MCSFKTFFGDEVKHTFLWALSIFITACSEQVEVEPRVKIVEKEKIVYKNRIEYKDKVVYKHRTVYKDRRVPVEVVKVVYKEPKREPRQILILVMEAGGIRGLMQARFLELLEIGLEKEKTKIHEKFDFFAGSSIGGLHALLFAVKQGTAKELMKFYSRGYYERIFKKLSTFLTNAADTVVKNAYGIFQAAVSLVAELPKWEKIPTVLRIKYYETEKLAVVNEVFGNLKLSDAVKDVIVPTYRLNSSDTTLHHFIFL